MLNLLIQARNNLNGNSSKWFTYVLSFEATTSKGYLESFQTSIKELFSEAATGGVL